MNWNKWYDYYLIYFFLSICFTRKSCLQRVFVILQSIASFYSLSLEFLSLWCHSLDIFFRKSALVIRNFDSLALSSWFIDCKNIHNSIGNQVKCNFKYPMQLQMLDNHSQRTKLPFENSRMFYFLDNTDTQVPVSLFFHKVAHPIGTSGAFFRKRVRKTKNKRE